MLTDEDTQGWGWGWSANRKGGRELWQQEYVQMVSAQSGEGNQGSAI